MAASGQESLAVRDYLASHDAVRRLGEKLPLLDIFRRPEADPLARLWWANPPAERLLDYYQRMVAADFDTTSGITTLKVKVGIDAKRDIELVRRLRAAVGPDVKLRVDANQGYKSWKEALQVTRVMQGENIWYMEQPCEGLENMARVAQNTDVPVMADESAWTAHDVLRIIQFQAAEMLSVYYTKPGGLLKSKKLLAVAEAAGLRCDINGSGEMGIGNAANLHLAASSAIIDLPGTIPVTSTAQIVRTKVAGHKYLDDIIEEPFIYRDGCMLVPEGPGLGITVNEAKLDQYSVG
jgi:muconate cycloisomerase